MRDFVEQINHELIRNDSCRNRQQCLVPIDKKTWFFLKDTTPLQSLIITSSNLVIYEASLKKTQPTLVHMKHKLQIEADIERYKSRTLGKERFRSQMGTSKTHI